MNIKETITKVLKVSELRPNEGQITGVPSNPRQISRSEFEGLCNSLREDNLTGVLQLKVYNHGGEWVVLDGNMRLKALQTIGIDDVQCLIVPEGTDEKTLRKIVISANSTFGEWDMDMLANEWNEAELTDWGVDVPKIPNEEDLQHMCKSMRGAKNQGEMSVAVLRGIFKENADLRMEFYKMIDLQR